MPMIDIPTKPRRPYLKDIGHFLGGLFVAIVIALLLVALFAPKAEAAPRHRHHAHHVSKTYHVKHRAHHRHHRHHVRRARQVRSVEQPNSFGFFNSWSGSDIVSYARSQIGNGPRYGRRTLWCARFMNVVLQRTGHVGTGSDMAASFAKLPRTTPHVGAIAVMTRRGGGHVGVVTGFDAKGNPRIVSGNHNNRVVEAVYPRSRVYAWVRPRR